MQINIDHIMKFKNWRKMAFILAMIGVTQFIILSTIAMVFYTGGTEINPTTSGYSFFTNFFSDLGRTQSLSGESNFISMILFIIALISVNMFFIPFFIAMTYFFSEKRTEKLFCNLAAISGVISALGGIGIALFPADLFPTAHLYAFIALGTFFAISLSLFTISIFLNDSYPNHYGYVIISYTFIWVFFTSIIMILIGFGVSTVQLFFVLATGQKILLYLGFLCIFVLAFGALKRYNRLSQDSFFTRKLEQLS